MKAKNPGKDIKALTDGHWEWFLRKEQPPYEITGKYLFFSADRELLKKIVIEELESGNFHQAKIPMAGKSVSPEYVLCLYYKDDSRKHELASKYRNLDGVKYRYWKSDQATRKGEYSEQFLHSLTPEDRKLFIGNKPKQW